MTRAGAWSLIVGAGGRAGRADARAGGARRRRRRLRGLRRRRWRRRRGRRRRRRLRALHPDPDPVPDRRARPRPRRARPDRARPSSTCSSPAVSRAPSAPGRRAGSSGPKAHRRVANASAASSWPRPRPPRTTPRSPPTPSRPTPPRCSSRSRPPGTAATAPACARLVGPDLLTEWERRLDDFDRRGWRNRVQVDRRADRRVRRPRPQRRRDTTRVTVRIEAKLRDYVEDRLGQPHQARRPPVRDRPPAGVLDARRTQQRPLDPGLDRAGRRGHARDRRRDRRHHVVGRDRACATRRWSRAPSQDAVPAGTNDRRGRRPRLRGRRPRRRARPEPRRRPVRARRARGGRAPGVTAWAEAVDGDDARLRSLAHGQAVRDLLHPGDPSGQHPPRRARPEGQADPDRRARRRRRSRRRCRSRSRSRAGATSRIATPPRSSPAAVARHEVHRALDVRARRRRAAAVADRRRRRPGPAGVAPTPDGSARRRTGLSSAARDPAEGQHPDGSLPVRHVRADRRQRVVYLLAVRHGGSLISGPTPARRSSTARSRTRSPTPATSAAWSTRPARRSRAPRHAAGRDPHLADRVHGDVHARLDHPHRRQHAVPVDLRQQRRGLDGPGQVLLLLHRSAGSRRWRSRSRSAPTRRTPTLGASGAIAAVLGGYILLYPQARVLTLVLIIFFFTVIELPALVMLGIWFAEQAVFAAAGLTTATGGGGGVAYFAHVGGFVFGLLTIKLLATRRSADSYAHPGLLLACACRPHDRPAFTRRWPRSRSGFQRTASPGRGARAPDRGGVHDRNHRGFASSSTAMSVLQGGRTPPAAAGRRRRAAAAGARRHAVRGRRFALADPCSSPPARCSR